MTWPDESWPDDIDAAERFAASPLFPRNEDGPVFAEPWQAQAVAIAVQLSANGHFTWTEWTVALGEQLQAFADMFASMADKMLDRALEMAVNSMFVAIMPK